MTRVRLLDHGYLEVIEHWGSDEAIVSAARMSTGKGFLGWGGVCPNCPGTTQRDPSVTTCVHCGAEHKPFGSGDEKLLRFLWEHEHGTPFEMVGITFEVQAPIFVFREWHRHRVPFGYNEMSARYAPLPDVNYAPAFDRLLLVGDGKNRQAGTVVGAGVLSEATGQAWLDELHDLYEHAQRVYESGLQRGVPKELARVGLPVGRYSRMRATGNLRGWIAFCKLRMAPGAQWEIRQYANAVANALAEAFPRTWAIVSESLPGGAALSTPHRKV